jgi:cobalt/nickel transport system permease protein
MQTMMDEPFANGASVIHRLDPRFRVAAATGYAVVVALSYGFASLTAAAAISVSLVLLARLHPGRLLRRLLVVNGFIALFWIMLPLTYGGDRVYPIGPVHLSMDGVLLAAKLTVKSNAILLALIALVASQSFAATAQALQRLRVPAKLVFLLMLTYRYIFVIEQEYQKIHRALKIRGFQPSTSLHAYKTFAYVIGMLFVRASRRADRVYRAMRCRGFSGRFYSLAEYQASVANWIFLGAVTVAAAGIICLEWICHG